MATTAAAVAAAAAAAPAAVEPKKCSGNDCKCDPSALCLHCNKHVCMKHYLEHMKLIHDELFPLSDQLNGITSALQQLPNVLIAQHAEKQLDNWRMEIHRSIDQIYDQKKKVLNSLVQLKLDAERSISKHLSDAVREKIDQNDATHEQIIDLTQKVKALETRCNTLQSEDFFHVDIEPFKLGPDALVIKAQQLNYFFGGGTLLCLEHQVQLNKWVDESRQTWQLVYKATVDGFTAENFHHFSDDKGPTITIIQSKEGGWLFGGYTSQDWKSTETYADDKNQPFLFTLTNPHQIPPTKYVIDSADTAHAIGNHPSYGPCFGNNDDIRVCGSSNVKNGSVINFPITYIDSTGKGPLTFTGQAEFQTSEIEVYAAN